MDMQKSNWIVVTNTHCCRVYQYNPAEHRLELIQERTHPENKKNDFNLTSDKPGRYQTDHGTHGTFSQETDPKAIKIQAFAKEIAELLDEGRKHNAYHQWMLVSEPHMFGLVCQHLNHHVEEKLSHKIHKDLMTLNEVDLLSYLKTHG